MIKGVHTMFYSSEAAALREFIRDKLGFPCVDTGNGWLIFDLPEADLGCHPTDNGPPTGTADISFYCDDIDATVRELEAAGVEFTGEPIDRGYGIATRFKVPGDFTLELYQPKYGK